MSQRQCPILHSGAVSLSECRRGEHDVFFPISKPPDLHAWALIELAVPARTRQSGSSSRTYEKRAERVSENYRS